MLCFSRVSSEEEEFRTVSSEGRETSIGILESFAFGEPILGAVSSRDGDIFIGDIDLVGEGNGSVLFIS